MTSSGADKKQLAAEIENWERTSGIIARFPRKGGVHSDELPGTAWREHLKADGAPGASRFRDLLLVRVSRFVCRRAQEHTPPIRKRNVLADRNVAAVLALIALHDDLGSGRQGIFV